MTHTHHYIKINILLHYLKILILGKTIYSFCVIINFYNKITAQILKLRKKRKGINYDNKKNIR